MTATGMTVMDAVVLFAAVFAALFLVAWVFSTELRAWIERPKYRFLADVERYDVERRDRQGGKIPE